MISWGTIVEVALYEVELLSYRMGYRFSVNRHHMIACKLECLVQESTGIGVIATVTTTLIIHLNNFCFLSQ